MALLLPDHTLDLALLVVYSWSCSSFPVTLKSQSHSARSTEEALEFRSQKALATLKYIGTMDDQYAKSS